MYLGMVIISIKNFSKSIPGENNCNFFYLLISQRISSFERTNPTVLFRQSLPLPPL